MTSNNIFRWKKATSNHQHKSDTTGVRDWIKRVQTLSDEASREVFGDDISDLQDLHVIQPDDQALYEAQELLDKWVQDKHVSDINLELEFKDENWSSSTKPILNSQKYLQNNHIDNFGTLSLLDNGKIVLGDNWHSNSDLNGVDEDDIDYEQDVKEMFKKFMDNPTLESSVLNDLGMDKVTKKFKDPRPKMEQRQKMVKERNQARQKKVQEKRRDMMMRKEAIAVAKKKLIEEERAKQIQVQNEEEAVQQEMARIRKELEEKRRRNKEEQNRKRKIAREVQNQICLEDEKIAEMEREKDQRRIVAEEKMRKQILIEMEEKSLQEAADNLRTLHKHFSAWYNLVVAHRVKIGKSRAVSDWRCKLRAWNAWKAYVLHIKSNKEAQEMAVLMKIKHRQDQMSINHYRLKLLRKCFVGWQLWITEMQRVKRTKEEHQQKAAKMASFLEAAASGRLWGDENSANLKEKGQDFKKKSSIDTENEVEEIFLNEIRSKNIPKLHAKSNKLSLQFPKKKEPNAWLSPARTTQHCNNGNEETKKDCNIVEEQQNEKMTIVDDPVILKAKEKHTKKNNLENGKPKAPGCRTMLSSNHETEKVESKPCNEEGLLEEDLKIADQKQLVSRKPIAKSNKPTTKPVRLAMEERAEQRAKRKAIMDEKRKQQDEAKLERLRIEQEKLILAELQLKNERLQQKKEEKRIQKEQEIEKRKRLEAYNIACRKADDHYRRTLLKRAGIEPWKRLIQIGKLNDQIAEKYCQRTSLRSVFNTWLDFTVDVKSMKSEMCQNFYQHILKRKCFYAWTKYGQHFELLENLARRHCDNKVLDKYFTIWQHFVTNERLKFWSDEEKAEEHNNRRLMKSVINLWKSFIAELKDDREKEKRRNQLRKKVKEWLPDFGTL